MSEVVSMNELRADKAKNATLWTPLDCARALVRDLESGRIEADMVFVAMAHDDGHATAYPSYAAGANVMAMRGLLAQHLHQLCALKFEEE